MSNLTFNILTFKHPAEEYTFYFTNEETEGLFGIYNTLVPDEVIEHFGEQERYYTSFDNPVKGLFSVTKKSYPVYIEMINEDEETITVKEKNMTEHPEKSENGNKDRFRVVEQDRNKVYFNRAKGVAQALTKKSQGKRLFQSTQIGEKQ